MNTLGMVIAANVFATIAILCGLKLFDLGSSLADPIRKYSPILGIIFAFIAIFNFLLKDTLDLTDGNYTLWMVVVSMIGFAFYDFMVNFAKRGLLEPKSKESRKRGRVSKMSVTAVALLDILSGAIFGAAAGISFTLNFGTGIVTLCSLILLQIVMKVAVIRHYQDARFTRKENITVLVLSLATSPIVASLVNLWARDRYRHVGIFMALAIGYLAYLGIYQVVLIVKKFQNR